MQDFPFSPVVMILTFICLCSCSSTSEVAYKHEAHAVKTWGSMREVLREGNTGGRVQLTEVVHAKSMGVGALAELKGEITVIDGVAFVSTFSDERPNSTGVPVTRRALDSDQAALLVMAEVNAWKSVELAECSSYEELERKISHCLIQHHFDLFQPTPIRISGIAERVDFHVIAGSCPIAEPEGTPPWRGSVEGDPLELVGIYVEGSAGKLTHHQHNSHLHVISGSLTGHVDALSLRNATLQIPLKNPN